MVFEKGEKIRGKMSRMINSFEWEEDKLGLVMVVRIEPEANGFMADSRNANNNALMLIIIYALILHFH